MKVEQTEEYIAVHGDFKVLSSAVYNGGFTRAKTILNAHVREDFTGNAFEFFDSLADEKGLKKDEIVGMMTAVPMDKAQISANGEVTAIITAGIGKKRSSTVNIILLINRNLAWSAMANVLIVATEAKAAAFFDLDVRYETGEIATGDATDSVVVACYGHDEDEEELFAGKATELGKKIYGLVRGGVRDALLRYTRWKIDRPILERLAERGITIEEMVSTALELYVPVGDDPTNEEELRRRLGEIMRKECADLNVALLLAAALHAEEEEIHRGRAGRAGGEDAACIVADELIGIDIAEYIGGKRALFNFFYYDTRKPGMLKRLGVFMDDAIGGLIAGCMTKMLG